MADNYFDKNNVTYSQSLEWSIHDNIEKYAKYYSIYSEWYDRLFEKDNNLSSKKVLDIGCSCGYLMYYLLKKGFGRVDGIDLDSRSTAQMQRVIKNSWPEFADRMNISIGDGLEYTQSIEGEVYDYIFLNAVIEHIKKEKILPLLNHIYRLLKPGGRIIIMTGNMENPLNLSIHSRDYTHEVMFTGNSLKQILRFTRFRDICVYTAMPSSLIRKLHFFIFSFIVKAVLFTLGYKIEYVGKLLIATGRKVNEISQ